MNGAGVDKVDAGLVGFVGMTSYSIAGTGNTPVACNYFSNTQSPPGHG